MVTFDIEINLPTTFDLESNAEQESIIIGYIPTIAVTFGRRVYLTPPAGYPTLDTLHPRYPTPLYTLPPRYRTPDTPQIPYCLDALPPGYPTFLIPYLPDTLPPDTLHWPIANCWKGQGTRDNIPSQKGHGISKQEAI